MVKWSDQCLAFIDRLDDGAGTAEAVVVDLTTGEEVVRSDEGLVPDDESGDDVDWTDLYEDAPVSVLGVVGDTAYVRGLGDLVSHDLSTGEVDDDRPLGHRARSSRTGSARSARRRRCGTTTGRGASSHRASGSR